MPARSMTGFGEAVREAEGVSVRVEARSVNHRSLALSVRLPRDAESLETGIETAVKRRLARGSVTVHVTIERARTTGPSRIVREVFLAYAADAAALARDAGLAPPTAGDVLRLPGVVLDAPPPAFADSDGALVESAVAAALDGLVAMRAAEGASLVAELNGILDEIEKGAAIVRARCPEVVELARDRMRERIGQLLAPGSGVPEDLVAREIAVLADRSDVAEELARLASHVAQARAALAEDAPVGRRLEFLAQEFGRETNTIGSKSQDPVLARTVVALKVAVERLKEQSANLE